ncbi:MAG: membrane dipeptidase [Oscillospiraceae bacterium]|nr:membrane dipeptidase [Oscillospiraceae bacterium]
MTVPLFDAHCDTALCVYEKQTSLRENGLHTDLARRCAFSPCAQFFAVFSDAGETDPATNCRAELRYFKKELAKNADLVSLCRTAEEAKAAVSGGKTAAFLSVEGAEQLGCSLDGLAWAYEEGVRAVNLTWNYANALSGSNADEPERGLSDEGKAFVRRCRELGVLPDVSHLSERGFWDLYELGGPIFASHSNAKAVFGHKRNLTDEQFRAVAESGGFAGLNLYAAFLGERPTLDTVIAHAEHFLALGGEKALGLGADLDGCDELPEGITGVQDMGKLYEAFLRRNYGEDLVRDIFWGNLFSLIERNVK